MSEELDGWIAIQRRVFKAGKFKDAPFSEREAWIWLIAKAVFKPTTHRIGSTVYDVPRGSRFYTIRELMSAWKWGNTKVRNYLVFLEKQDMALSENKSGKTLVTICNYNEYQFDKSQTNQPQITDKPDANQDQITKEQDKQISSSFHSEDNNTPLPPTKPDNSKIEINQAFEAYNLAASENDWAVCQKISKARNSQMKARLKDCGGIDGFMACLEKCKASDFLQGRVGGANGTFQLGIDFILRDSSFTKIMEGNYDNRKQPEKQKSMSSASMFFEAARQAEGLSQ